MKYPPKVRVYVAGPLTKGDQAANVREAMLAGLSLMAAGFAAYIPHLTHFLHLLEPKSYEFWLEQDLEWLRACHAVLRLPGESDGADREVSFARSEGVPVYHSVRELLERFHYVGRG